MHFSYSSSQKKVLMILTEGIASKRPDKGLFLVKVIASKRNDAWEVYPPNIVKMNFEILVSFLALLDVVSRVDAILSGPSSVVQHLSVCCVSNFFQIVLLQFLSGLYESWYS